MKIPKKTNRRKFIEKSIISLTGASAFSSCIKSSERNEQKNVNIGGVVTYIGQTRDVSLKSGSVEKVTTITVQDDSGSIPVNIWGSIIEKIKINSEIRLEKGYINEFRNQIQFNLGYYGKLFILLNSTTE